jgi:two-component system nitrate/nitrite response regulator NarL
VSTHSRLRVVIVDDHPGFRSLMSELLRSSGHEVVGEAHDRSTAVRVVDRCVPDVVFVDLGLGEESGFDVATARAETEPPPDILLMSADECPDLARVKASGARAFLAKSRISPAQLAGLGV